jgi:hypothetical protein
VVLTRLLALKQTVETVLYFRGFRFTGLKPGVNERLDLLPKLNQ